MNSQSPYGMDEMQSLLYLVHDMDRKETALMNALRSAPHLKPNIQGIGTVHPYTCWLLQASMRGCIIKMVKLINCLS